MSRRRNCAAAVGGEGSLTDRADSLETRLARQSDVQSIGFRAGPSMRIVTDLCRHLATVCGQQPVCVLMLVFAGLIAAPEQAHGVLPVQEQQTRSDAAEMNPLERLQAASRLLRNDPTGACEAAEATLNDYPDLPSAMRAELYWIAGAGASLSAQHPRAVDLLNQSESLARELKRTTLLRRIFRYQAASFFEVADYQAGSDAAQEGIQICDTLNDSSEYEIALYNELAGNEQKLGRYDRVLAAYYKALALAAERNDSQKEVLIRVNLAGLLTEFNFLQEAIDEYERSLSIVQNEHNEFMTAAVSAELGKVLTQFSERRGEADALFETALRFAMAAGHTDMEAGVREAMGDLAVARGQDDAALALYQKALTLWQALQSPSGVAGIQVKLTGLVSGDSADACIALQTAQLEQLTLLKDHQHAAMVARRLVDYYRQLGDWPRVAALQDRVLEAEQRLWKAQHSKELSLLQRSMEARDSQRKIAALEASAQDQAQRLNDKAIHFRNLAIVLSFTAILLVVLALVLRGRNRANAELRVANAELRLQKQVQQAFERRLADQQKTESLSLMAAGIAHDFNNLLTVISGSAELGTMLESQDQNAELFRQIQTTSLQAAELTSQLVQFLGEQPAPTQATDLTAVVASVAGLLKSIVRSKGTLLLAESDRFLPAGIEETHARQVLVNLVSNAADALQQGGTIQVEVGEQTLWTDDLALMPVNESAESGLFRFLRITDDGSGIPAALVQRIFDPYFSTKSSGRGLGLASVMGIVRSCGGAVRVSPVATGGTQFTVYVPAADHADCPPRRDDNPMDPVSADQYGRQRIVVLVDDEPMVADAMARIIQTAGYRVLTSHGARQAIALVENNLPDVVCVVTDYSMPDESGLWLADHIKQHFAHLPVVMCSGYTDQARNLDGRVDAFLQKPYSGRALLEEIQNCTHNNRVNKPAESLT